MTIIKHTVPYEILFRLTDTGAVAGCHRRDLEVVKDDETDEVFSVKESDPKVITGDDMDTVLGVINTGLSQTCVTNQALITQLQTDHIVKDQFIAALQEEGLLKDQLIAHLQGVVASLVPPQGSPNDPEVVNE